MAKKKKEKSASPEGYWIFFLFLGNVFILWSLGSNWSVIQVYSGQPGTDTFEVNNRTSTSLFYPYCTDNIGLGRLNGTTCSQPVFTAKQIMMIVSPITAAVTFILTIVFICVYNHYKGGIRNGSGTCYEHRKPLLYVSLGLSVVTAILTTSSVILHKDNNSDDLLQYLESSGLQSANVNIKNGFGVHLAAAGGSFMMLGALLYNVAFVCEVVCEARNPPQITTNPPTRGGLARRIPDTRGTELSNIGTASSGGVRY